MPIWLAGILGGIIAGGVMLGGIMTLAPFRGFGEFFAAPRLVAASVLYGAVLGWFVALMAP